jgi:hypothetical protein
MGYGKPGLCLLALELADADQDIGRRNFKGKVVESFLTETVDVWIPRFTRPNVVASAARVGQHFIAAVFHRDWMDFADSKWFAENGIEGAISLSIFVFEIVAEKKIQMRDDYCIENYVNDPQTTPEDQLVTQILIPTA